MGTFLNHIAFVARDCHDFYKSRNDDGYNSNLLFLVLFFIFWQHTGTNYSHRHCKHCFLVCSNLTPFTSLAMTMGIIPIIHFWYLFKITPRMSHDKNIPYKYNVYMGSLRGCCTMVIVYKLVLPLN